MVDEELLKKDEELLKKLVIFKNTEIKQAYKKFSIDKGIPCVTDFTLYKWATGRSLPTSMNRVFVREFFEKMNY